MVGRITDTIQTDHRTIEASYTRLLDASQKDERVRFKNLLAWGLSRNLVGKELVVYPALEKRLGEGGALANRARNENHSVRQSKQSSQHPIQHITNRDSKDQGRFKSSSASGPVELRVLPYYQPLNESVERTVCG